MNKIETVLFECKTQSYLLKLYPIILLHILLFIQRKQIPRYLGFIQYKTKTPSLHRKIRKCVLIVVRM